MPGKLCRAPETAAEILRATRQEWVTKAQIAEQCELSKKTAVLWVSGLESRGVLKSRDAPKWAKPGPRPREFKLASQWGGLDNAMLPADVARCPGREAPTVYGWSPECDQCKRRTDRSTFPLQVWTSPPKESPCPLRMPEK